MSRTTSGRKKKSRPTITRRKAIKVVVSRGVVAQMRPSDLKVLNIIKKLYVEGKIRHLSWRQIHDVACSQANFPGKIGSLQEYLRSRGYHG